MFLNDEFYDLGVQMGNDLKADSYVTARSRWSRFLEEDRKIAQANFYKGAEFGRGLILDQAKLRDDLEKKKDEKQK